MNNKKNNLLIYGIIIFLLTSIDQLSKQLMYNLSYGIHGYSMRVLGNFLRFTYVENYGGIFGVFQGHIKIFTLVSTILIVYISLVELKNYKK